MTNQDYEKYKRLMQFAKTKGAPRQGLSNLYLLQSIDENGNIVDEAYGMNMMTNYGFSQYCFSNQSWPDNTYIGDFTGDRTNTSLISDNAKSIYGYFTPDCDDSNLRDTTIDYNYPMYYYPTPGSNPETGIVTCVCKFRECTFPLNLTNVNESKVITEYGIGSSYNALWTHTWVYDIQGALSSITKHTNTILTITIYLCMSYDTSMIRTGWSNDQHISITTLTQFLGRVKDFPTMSPRIVGTYCRYNSLTSREKDVQKTTIQNNSQTMTVNVGSKNNNTFTGSIILRNETSDDQGYIDGWFSFQDGFYIIEPQTLNVGQEETFELDLKLPIPYVLDSSLKTYLSTYFGKKNDTNAIPITQLTMDNNNGDGIWLYDNTLSSYSVNVPYTNNENHWYTETSFFKDFAIPITTTDSEGHVITSYLYTNTHPEDPIIKFNNPSGISTIYGTDAYWNKTGGEWKYIPSPSSVPQNAQNCHYYVTNTNEASLNPVRSSLPLTITPSSGEYKSYNYSLNMNRDSGGAYATCSNHDTVTSGDTLFFVRNTTVCIPTTGTNVTLYQINDQGSPITSDTSAYGSSLKLQHYAYRNKLLTSIYNNKHVYLTNVSNPNQISCTPIDMSTSGLFDDSTTDLLSPCYKTESMTGIVCYHHPTLDTTIVFDLTRGTNYTTTKFTSTKMACAIYDTRPALNQRVAYMTSTEIHIYDFGQSDDILTLNLPEPGGTTATDCYCMWGFKDHLYMMGNGWTWHWDLSSNDQDGNSCGSNLPIITNKTDAQYLKFSVAKNIMIIYKYNHNYPNYSGSNKHDFQCIYYLNLDDFDPETIPSLVDFRFPSNDASTTLDRYMQCLYLKLQYIENDKVLALIYQFSQNTSETSNQYHYGKMEHGIIDFGQYINPPSGYQPIVNNNVRKSDTAYTDKSSTSETEFYDNGVCTWTVFGENIVYGNQQVPIAALMPMHFKGRTRTITALNHIKNLTNKTFTVTYANSAPAYWPQDGDHGTGGYPPGNKN